MTVLLYAVSAQGASVNGNGLQGRRLRSIPVERLQAVVSDLDEGSLDRSEETLWDYEESLERLMAQNVILPARFGSVLADEDAVRATLTERQNELLGALDRVQGAVEFGVTTGWRDIEEPASSGTGTAYLLGRLELHRRASEIARQLDPLAALSRSSRQRVLPRPSLPVTASYLVEQHKGDEFIEMVAHLDSLLVDVDVVCTGPWPPYSFVEGVPQ